MTFFLYLLNQNEIHLHCHFSEKCSILYLHFYDDVIVKNEENQKFKLRFKNYKQEKCKASAYEMQSTFCIHHYVNNESSGVFYIFVIFSLSVPANNIFLMMVQKFTMECNFLK